MKTWHFCFEKRFFFAGQLFEMRHWESFSDLVG